MLGALTSPAYADNASPSIDLSLKTGVSLGTIQIETVSKTNKSKTQVDTYTLGGIPLQAALNFDIWERFTLQMGPTLLVDAPNSVILRQGLEMGGVFHVVGGARRLSRGGEAIGIVATSAKNMSVGLRFGLHNYATRVDQVEFSGSVFEGKMGLEYRRDVGTASALGAEIYTTVLTMPSSVTRIRYQAVEILGFWRTFL